MKNLLKMGNVAHGLLCVCLHIFTCHSYLFRSGSIFDATFMSDLLRPAEGLPELSDQLKRVLLGIQEEAICSSSDIPETMETVHSDDTEEPNSKRPRLDTSPNSAEVHPPFYINIHKRRFKDAVIPK
jgi:hypothetical protein